MTVCFINVCFIEIFLYEFNCKSIRRSIRISACLCPFYRVTQCPLYRDSTVFLKKRFGLYQVIKYPSLFSDLLQGGEITLKQSFEWFIYLSIYLSIHLSIYLSIYLSVYISVYVYIYPSICQYIYLSTSLSIYLSVSSSVFLSVFRFVCLSVGLGVFYLSIFQSIYLSMYLFI